MDDGARQVQPGGARAGGLGSIAISLSVHALLAVAILGAARGVATGVASRDEEPPVVLTADFASPAPGGPAIAARTPAASDAGKTSTDERADEAADEAADAASAGLSERLRALERAAGTAPALDALVERFGAEVLAGQTAEDSMAARRSGASFAGLVSGSATKVAYVVDASGSMVGRFPAIVDEVERSLARLEPTQRFTVICFRRDGAMSLDEPPALVAASRAERERAVRWMRESVVPAGRSSPLEAIALALGTGADCVFLLSTTRTGSGSHEFDRTSTLALLDRLNPRHRGDGPRRASIQCIQFLDEDPGGTLEAIAAEHFGDGGYRFIPRSATSLDAAATPSETTGAHP